MSIPKKISNRDYTTIFNYMTGGDDLYPPSYHVAKEDAKKFCEENNIYCSEAVIGAVEVELLLKQAGDI